MARYLLAMEEDLREFGFVARWHASSTVPVESTATLPAKSRPDVPNWRVR